MGKRAAAMTAVGLLCLAGCSGDNGDDAAPAETVEAVTTMTTTPAPASSRSLATTVEPAPDLPGYNVYRPSDLEATGAPLPVVVWANGGCFRHDATWQTLLERWAAAGFLAEAAEVGINWMDLVLYGNETARRAVAERPCGACAAELWTVAAKHLDTLPVA
ncbi:MAG: hypothetical protein ABW310_03480 [Acidimicrobiales bacterium]